MENVRCVNDNEALIDFDSAKNAEIGRRRKKNHFEIACEILKKKNQ